MARNSPNYSNGKVEFWKTATGTVTSSFNDWSFVLFSPTNPHMAVIRGSRGIQLVKRNSPEAEVWNISGKANSNFTGGIVVFISDGKTITAQTGVTSDHLFELDISSNLRYSLRSIVTEGSAAKAASSIAYCPLEPESFLVGRNNGRLDVVSYNGRGPMKIRCQLNPPGSVRISTCAWSQDRKWIATGNDHGDILLWNASVTTRISLAWRLPTHRISPITSLIFVPDSTALIILCGGYLTLWDIAKRVYVDNFGLPAMAMNIALDGPRNRVAVAVEDTIFLYELKLPQQPEVLRQQALPGLQTPLTLHNRQTIGKPFIPSELAEFDVTNKVTKSKSGPYVSLYFDIYRGVCQCNFDTPRVFQHAVAIKALRPGFKPRSKIQERQDFEDVCKFQLLCIFYIHSRYLCFN